MHMAAQGGHLEVIKFLSRKFGARVHEKDSCGYTVLHWAAQQGHCEVARYLTKELKMDPQDRDKVCGMPGEGMMCSKVQGLHASCMCEVKHVVTRRCHLITSICNVVRENSPVLCLQIPIHSFAVCTGFHLVVDNTFQH